MSAMAKSSTVPVIRRAVPEDAPACGRICHQAFHTLNTQHAFPPDFPTPEAAIQVLTWMFSHPQFYCVIAEDQGVILGSNCLDERGSQIAGLGPITIEPTAQNKGVGGKLMQAVLDRANERCFAGVRLIQAAFHCRSLSLYAKLGFAVRESLAVMQGTPSGERGEGLSVRTAELSDVESCNALCRRVHGHDRGGELQDGIKAGTARVVERARRIVAYSSGLGFFGHSVAESNQELQALIAAAEQLAGPGILVPTRNAALFRWCLESGLRVVEPMSLMTLGMYNEPRGTYLASVLF